MGEIIAFTRKVVPGMPVPIISRDKLIYAEYERLRDSIEALNHALADAKRALLA